MGRLVEFDLNDGGTILVEVHEMTRTGGPVTRGLSGDQVTERARHTFEDAVERVEPAAQAPHKRPSSRASPHHRAMINNLAAGRRVLTNAPCRF